MYKYKVKVNRVIDGDTLDAIIDLGFNIFIKERLRLFGIDTPETRTRDMEEKKEGLKSKEYVKKRIAKADSITIESEKKGKFGRYLATIFIDGVNLNQELLDRGLAKKYN